MPVGRPLKFVLLICFFDSSLARADMTAQDADSQIVKALMECPDAHSLLAIEGKCQALPLEARVRVIRAALAYLDSTKAVRLQVAEDIIIVPRIGVEANGGKGNGLMIWQDMDIEGGRAAWLIGSLLQQEMPVIKANLTEQERKDAIRQISAFVKAYLQGIDDQRKSTSSGTNAGV